jgi:hypothetical protein
MSLLTSNIEELDTSFLPAGVGEPILLLAPFWSSSSSLEDKDKGVGIFSLSSSSLLFSLVSSLLDSSSSTLYRSISFRGVSLRFC